MSGAITGSGTRSSRCRDTPGVLVSAPGASLKPEPGTGDNRRRVTSSGPHHCSPPRVPPAGLPKSTISRTWSSIDSSTNCRSVGWSTAKDRVAGRASLRCGFTSMVLRERGGAGKPEAYRAASAAGLTSAAFACRDPITRMRRFDTIVLGLGAMGSATLCQLARRGNGVLGIDQFSPPHALGSSHGDTRITRLAIGEGEQYTPLALRSHQLWRELEKETGTELLTTCGGLIISSSAKTSRTHVEHFFDNTLAAARKFAIAHEVLDAAEIRRRFPRFNVADDEQGYFEPGSGFLRPEACVRAQLMMAERRGAEIHREERVSRFDASANAVTVTTDKNTYMTRTLIVTAGPWLPGLVDPRLAQHFTVYRQ